MQAAIMRVRFVKEVNIPNLGAQIKERRLEIAKSKSLAQICREVGFSQTYWYDIEKDTIRGALSIENLRKIEKALSIDLGVSFDEEEEK